jgi:nucleotide-binding universal stress UspA family protein
MAFQRILFPFDFSEAAMAMTPSVIAMAQRFNASVTVLNAFHQTPGYILIPRFQEESDTAGSPVPYTPALEKLRTEREQELNEYSRTHFSSVNFAARIEDGDPAMVIEWVAKRENTDMIMMPTKGLGRFRRLLLGSVTAKVLHDVECPVFTSAHEPDSALASTGGWQSILCAVRLGPESENTLRVAGLLAQACDARVCLLHIQSSDSAEEDPVTSQSLQHAFEQAMGSHADISLTTHISIPDTGISEDIRRIAIEKAADLVVVGRGHLRGNLSRAWSHVYSIIRESPCPVLSV